MHRPILALLLLAHAVAHAQQRPARGRMLWADPKPGTGGRAGLIEIAGDATDSIPANNPTTGHRPYVTLLCKFSDFPEVEPSTRERMQQLMAGTTYPSVNHYWTENSGGRFTLNGSQVYGWYTLPKPSTYYVSTFVRFSDLEQDCAAAADADVHFPDFVGINFLVNTNLDGRLYAGATLLDLDGGPARYVATYLDNSATINIGLAAHEVGHTFGLAHTNGGYGFEYDSKWDVMSHPGFYQDPVSGAILPAHTNALQKVRLGIIASARQKFATIGATSVLLERAALSVDSARPAILIVPIPGPIPASGARSYYAVEVRGGPGSGYDAAHPEQVVVIHKQSPQTGTVVVDVDGNMDPNDAAAQWKPGETFVDRMNGISIAVEEQVGTAMRLTVSVADRNLVAVTPAPHRSVIAFGDTVTRFDSASVTFSGASATTVNWTARSGDRRVLLSSSTGTGSGKVRWRWNPTGLGAGTYATSIEISAAGVANAPIFVADTLVITPPADLKVGLDVTSSNDTTLPDRVSGVRQAFVAISGSGADTATWSRARRAAWIEFLPAGRDSNPFFPLSLLWRHKSAGLAPGIYVDTIVVSLGNGATSRLVDTLTVLSPIQISLRRSFGSVSVVQAAPDVPDSVYADVTGSWAASAPIIATLSGGAPAFLAGAPTPRIGSGWVHFRRFPREIAPGVYVNRLRVRLAIDTGSYATYEDTLRILASTPRIVLSESSRGDTVTMGQSLSMDSVRVYPTGDGSTGRIWQTTANPLKTVTLPRNGTTQYGTGSGNGPGWLVWLRNSANRVPGVYVDTLRVRFALGAVSPTNLIDTLVILGPPALILGATSRHVALMAGSTAIVRDSVAVLATGSAWTAAKRKPWNLITTTSGTGAGHVRWERHITGLASGVHVDTITITAAGLANSPQNILDSLRVWPQLAILGDSARRSGIMGASYADTLRAEGGAGVGTWSWSRASGDLPPGVALDAASGMLVGVPEAAGVFRFVAQVKSDTFTVTRELKIVVTEPALVTATVMDHLLLGAGLTADQARYVDLLGNRNGRVDVGDVRAWLSRGQQ